MYSLLFVFVLLQPIFQITHSLYSISPPSLNSVHLSRISIIILLPQCHLNIDMNYCNLRGIIIQIAD